MDIGELFKKYDTNGIALATLIEVLKHYSPHVEKVPVYFCPECLTPGYVIETTKAEFNATNFTIKTVESTPHTKRMCPNGHETITKITVPKTIFIKTAERLLERYSGHTDIEQALVYATIILAKDGLAKSDVDPNKLYSKALDKSITLLYEIKAILSEKNQDALKTLTTLTEIVGYYGINNVKKLLHVFDTNSDVIVSFCGMCLSPGFEIKEPSYATVSELNEPINVEATTSSEYSCKSCGSSYIVNVRIPKDIYAKLIIKLVDNFKALDKAIVVSAIYLLKQNKADLVNDADPDELLELTRTKYPTILDKVKELLKTI